eukprot:GHVS01032485.1.p1 GENE.GHVS01032485.1~~GHVS01032485.1.p1  ORF type:complete len:102 (-),score=12.40 GHVS01032485.1:701-1006(-)
MSVHSEEGKREMGIAQCLEDVHAAQEEQGTVSPLHAQHPITSHAQDTQQTPHTPQPMPYLTVETARTSFEDRRSLSRGHQDREQSDYAPHRVATEKDGALF